jgi:hypothetical protein
MFQSANYRDRGISGQFGLSLCSPFTSGSSGSQEIIDFFFNWDYVQTPVTHSTNPSEKFNKVMEAIIFK